MAPRVGQTSKKDKELKKLRKRREQVKMAMRRHRQKLTEEQLEERRRKDRERYQRKKEQGEVKTIDQFTPRTQKIIRKQWKERSKKYRDNKKALQRIRQQTENFIEADTPPGSPATFNSRSRSESGRKIAKKKRRYLKLENAILKEKLRLLEKRVNKYKMRFNRANKRQKEGKVTSNISNKKGRVNEVKKQIINFLENDESSRLTAGTKETITRKKVKKQIRLLNDSLLNLYAKFKSTINHKISYSLFCRYRPFWIISPNAKQRDTCLCIHHTNMELIITALKTANVINEGTPVALVKTICCEGKLKEECLLRKCNDCREKKVNFNSNNSDNPLSYFRWITKKIPVSIKGAEKLCQKTIKEKVSSSRRDLVNHLLLKLPVFMNHLNNIYHQYQAINHAKRRVDQETAVLHIDFAENYICKYAEEVQAVHFGASKSQVSLHTAVLYHFGEYDSIITPFCTIAENLRHDPVFICNHLLPILNIIKTSHPNLKTMHFVSDGPSSQYRNKSMFFLMANFLAVNLNVQNLVWHYNEAGHGKGSPDGIGATVKRTADQSVARGKDVANFQQLIQCLEQNCNGVQIIPVDEDNVSTIENLLAKSVTPAFKGTLSVHQVTWNKDSPGLLHARKLSCIECRPDQICSHYEMGVINTEYSKIFTDQSYVLATSSSHNQPDPEEPGPSGVFSRTGKESPAHCVDTDDEDLIMVSIPKNRSRNFYFKSANGSSSESDKSNEEMKKKQFIDQVFTEASDFTKKCCFTKSFASDSSDEDIF